MDLRPRAVETPIGLAALALAAAFPLASPAAAQHPPKHPPPHHAPPTVSRPSPSTSGGGTRTLPSLRTTPSRPGGSGRRGGIVAGGGGSSRSSAYARSTPLPALRAPTAPVTRGMSSAFRYTPSTDESTAVAELAELAEQAPPELEGLGQRLVRVWSKAIDTIRGRDDLPDEHRKALLDLLEDLGHGPAGGSLGEVFRGPDDVEEGKALAQLYGNWFHELEEVAESRFGDEIGAYPLPSPKLVSAYLQETRTDSDSMRVEAARIEALGFLERTGFIEAVIGGNLIDDYDLVRGWLTAVADGSMTQEERKIVNPVIARRARSLLRSFQALVDRAEDFPRDLAEARAEHTDLDAPPEGLPLSLLRRVPAPASTRPTAPTSAAALGAGQPAGFDDVLGDDVASPASGGLPLGLLGLGGLAVLAGLGAAARWATAKDEAALQAFRQAHTMPAAPRPGDPAATFVSGADPIDTAPFLGAGSETRVSAPPAHAAATAPPSVPVPAAPSSPSKAPVATAPPSTAPLAGAAPAPASSPPDSRRMDALPGWLRGTLEARLPERYVDLRLIASGGMGSIVRAWDSRLARAVAIKVAPPHLAGVAELRARFTREAQALARLQHPGIASVIDIPDTPDGESPLMIMEFLEGADLSRRLTARGEVPVPEVVDWISQSGAALQFAHDQGVLHRDIKPANLFLLDTGEVKVVDFGLVAIEDMARLTMTGARMGSIPYMPPEQIRGERVDARADQFSLAASAFELLTGRLPYEPDDSMRLAPPRMAPLRPEVPGPMDVAVMRALAHSPDDRFASVQEFVEAFRASA